MSGADPFPAADDEPEDDGLTLAERNGVDPELWDHGVQADADRVPAGWREVEA